MLVNSPHMCMYMVRDRYEGVAVSQLPFLAHLSNLNAVLRLMEWLASWLGWDTGATVYVFGQ